MAGMFAANPEMSREQFGTFASLSVAHKDHLTAAGYAAVVPAENIPAWERSMRARGILEIRVTRKVASTVLVLPECIEPRARLDAALGFNLAAHPDRLRALDRARDTGEVTATPPHVMEDLGLTGRGWLTVAPVFRSGVLPETIQERRETIEGYAFLVYQLDQFLQEVLPAAPMPRGFHFRLLDVDDANRYRPITDPQTEPVEQVLFTEAYDIPVGNRYWRVIWEADPGFRTETHWTSLVILLFGLGAAVSVAVLVLVLSVQHSRAQTMVRQRNRELADSRDEVERTLEALRAANAKLKAADQAKSDFLSTVSHELRTPLTVIHEYVDMILGGSVGSIDEDAAEFLGVARNQLSRANRMLNELLDFAKLESDSLVLRPRFVATEEILHRVRKFFTPTAASGERELVVSIEGKLPRLWIDPDRLEQILGNLVSNSIKFTPRGGTIRVYGSRDGSEVVFLVEDDGPGIPVEQQRRLFERFYQARSDTHTAQRGVGLGLAIAHALTTMQGGEIAVDSSPGQGSCFVVRFPVRSVAHVLGGLRDELLDMAGGDDRKIQEALVSLPGGADPASLEAWIRAHVPQDGSCRVVRHDFDAAEITVILIGESNVLPDLAVKSRAVFPLVVWSPARRRRRRTDRARAA